MRRNEVQDPRKCWICLENETEDPDMGPFVDNLCVCTLQAHERCMLKWMLASGKPTVNCPQCKSKFVAVKKSHMFGLILRGLKRLLAAAAFFGVSFIVFRKVGGLYIRCVYAPFDADRILGVLPIPGLSSWANTVVKSINSLVVAGIPFVLLRRPSLVAPEPAQIEPPLLSLAMILMSRLDPQPTGWASLMISGITHSTYRFVVDNFVMNRFGSMPVQVPEIPVSRVLNLDRPDEDNELPQPDRQESIREASNQLNLWVDHGRTMEGFITRLLGTVVETVIRDAEGNLDTDELLGAHEESLLQNRASTPNDSDATESEDEEEDAAPGIQQLDFERLTARQVVHHVRAREEQGIIYPLLPEDHILSFFLLVSDGDRADPRDLEDWTTDYTNIVHLLVNSSRDPDTNMNDRIQDELWKLLYWLPLRLLESQTSRQKRIDILIQSEPFVLDTFKSLSFYDRSWDSSEHVHLIYEGSLESVALYVSLWIEERLFLRELPHDMMMQLDLIRRVMGDDDDANQTLSLIRNQMRNFINQERVRDQARDGEGVMNGDRAIVRAMNPALEWEQAVPVLIFPYASMAMSRLIRSCWPFSSLATMNRNLVAGGLVIVASDILRIGLATIQRWNRNKWYITRYDLLDEETQQLIRFQEDFSAF